MKVIEHIKPTGECTLKVKVWLLDRRIEFQVLEQKHRHCCFVPHDGYGMLAVESVGCPQLCELTLFLRGSDYGLDNARVVRGFRSNAARDAYYAKMKTALAAAAEAMK